MKKKTCTFVVLVMAFVLNSCLTMGSSGNMLNTVNALGYSDNQINIDYAKKIWNGPVKVVSEIQDIDYLASCDVNNINSLTIYVPYNLKGDAEYTAEIATVVSYFAEIYRQVQSKEAISIEKAIAHMKNSYDLIVNKYLIGNKIEPQNPRQFKELVNSLDSCDVNGTIYYFNGKAVLENDIVIKFTNQ
jgi:hypothetical protein